MTLNRKSVTTDQSRDTGMGLVLLALLVYVAQGYQTVLYGAIAVHVVNMAWPKLFTPVAVVWLGLSEVMGKVVSTIVMAVVFFAVVTPVGIIRRLAGHDIMKLRAFKASRESVMSERNHMFTAADMERPY